MTRPLTGTELKRLHREWRRRTQGRLALILDGVQNPFNLGSILRSAAAYGIDHVWLAGHVPPPTDTKVNKTALGSARYLRLSPLPDGAAAVEAARDEGYTVVGVELAEGARPLHELVLGDDVCLVLGHEDRGLARDTIPACDHVAYLPLVGHIGSLNVAVAAAVAMAEVRRQGWLQGNEPP